MTIAELKEQPVVILGLGINHQGLVQYLLRQGVSLTIRDSKPALQREFEEKYPEWKDLVRWEIMPDITQKLRANTLVFRTPSIPISRLENARKAGVRITSQTQLFFDLCPAEIIGITGTKGKGTTASLISTMLQAGYEKGAVYLAGNIGVDPFSFLDALTPQDLVILELSSFQLEDLQSGPHVAVMLRVTPDHLDHHRNLEEYANAKRNLLRHQGPEDIAIINADHPEMKSFIQAAPGKRYLVTRHTPARQSAWAETLEGKEVVFFQMESEIESFEISGRRLLGEHNLENILPAVLVGALYHVPVPIMQRSIRNFAGLEHRLAYIGTYRGVSFYDDSIATTPESSTVAMQAFAGRRIHLIAGGDDKGSKYEAWAKEVAARCTTVTLLPGALHGPLRRILGSAIHATHSKCLLLDKTAEPVMETVLSGIYPHLKEGDVVLLAPAARSGKPFADYKERGSAFVAAVQKRYAD